MLGRSLGCSSFIFILTFTTDFHRKPSISRREKETHIVPQNKTKQKTTPDQMPCSQEREKQKMDQFKIQSIHFLANKIDMPRVGTSKLCLLEKQRDKLHLRRFLKDEKCKCVINRNGHKLNIKLRCHQLLLRGIVYRHPGSQNCIK